jgi:hypothetical protein
MPFVPAAHLEVVVAETTVDAGAVVPRGIRRQALYVLLGFSAGLPFTCSRRARASAAGA